MPFEEEKGPGTHCVRMHYFPSKSWEFLFLSAYLSVNVDLDLSNIPKKSFMLAAFQAKDKFSCWDKFSYDQRATPTEELAMVVLDQNMNLFVGILSLLATFSPATIGRVLNV